MTAVFRYENNWTTIEVKTDRITLGWPPRFPLSRLSDESADIAEKRVLLASLGDNIADWASREVVRRGLRESSVTIVIVMRGGMLLFPAFYRQMANSCYGFVACQRSGEQRQLTYSEVPRFGSCRLVIYVDPFVATGQTMLHVIRHIRDLYSNQIEEIACCVACSRSGAVVLQEEGVTVAGFDLEQALTPSGGVSPDFGRLDAGDLVSGGGVVI